MINAELQHNPYLLETNVKFNGQNPKINSQIEKYENQLLSDWVKNVPQIFYDEMNGYDFDLFFSGTEYDFKNLKKAFDNEDVSPEQVRLIMRNELENAVVKCDEIRELLGWLRTEKNRQFDFKSFYNTNRELLEETYSCVLVRGRDELTDGLSFSLENIKTIVEIAGTNLTYVPVVFVVEESTLQQFRDELTEVLDRKDIEQKQLFFYTSPAMDNDYIVRLICDLGVKNPQLISGIDDGKVETYIKNYPMVAHVREVIKLVRNEVNEMNIRLKAKNEKSAIENAEVYYKISELENVIEKIKGVDSRFVDLDIYSGGIKFDELKSELADLIRTWKIRKTKAVGESDIKKNAIEYEQELNRYIADFFKKAMEYIQLEKTRIESEYKKIYLQQPLDAEYQPENIILNMPEKPEIKSIKEALMDLKEESYEEKKDLLDFFKVSSEPKEMILVVTSYYEKWREKAIKLIIPVVENYITESLAQLQDYYKKQAKSYHEKLVELYHDKMKQKNNIAAQLSDDERMLQEDNDWLITLKDQLMKIERG